MSSRTRICPSQAAEAARRIETFVADYVTDKSLSVGYASAADVAEISYPGLLYVIVGLGTVPVEVRVFRAELGGGTAPDGAIQGNLPVPVLRATLKGLRYDARGTVPQANPRIPPVPVLASGAGDAKRRELGVGH